MPIYRAYFVDREGHIHCPPKVIECADDQEAAEKAEQFADGQDVELWQAQRVVAKFRTDSIT
jgi:hypothetical protein